MQTYKITHIQKQTKLTYTKKDTNKFRRLQNNTHKKTTHNDNNNLILYCT